ncbi:MAG: MFS transporter, partial [Pseudomonas protegens]
LALAVTAQATAQAHWPLWFGALGMGLTAVATNAIAMSMLLRDPAFGGPAAASGLLSAGFFAGFALGPVLFGAVQQGAAGFANAWLMLITVLLLGAGLSLMLVRARRLQPGSADASPRA